MMVNWQVAARVVLGGLALALIGCGGQQLPPASGTVSFQDEPVEGAIVTFYCDEANTIATGTTDSQGRFTLTTYQRGPGAVAGRHQVTVRKMARPEPTEEESPSASGGSIAEMMEEAMLAPPPPTDQARDLLPPRYADPARSGLIFEVTKDGVNEFRIELE